MIRRVYEQLNNRFVAWYHRGQEPDEPCSFMKPTLSEIVDGTLPQGIRRQFAERHLLECSFCQNGLFNLLLLRERLHSLRYHTNGHAAHGDAPETGAETLTLTVESRTIIETQWARLDEKTKA